MGFTKTELQPKDKLPASLLNRMQDAIIENENIVSEHLIWNVDRNVGDISPSASFSFTITQSNSAATKHFSIPMISSGKLYLDFKVTLSCSSNTNYKLENLKVLIYINDELVKTCVELNNTHEEIRSCRTLLSVNKGDVVTLVAEGTLGEELSNSSTFDDEHFTVKIEGIQLKANIETACMYLSISEDLEEPTAEEILNALLGV